MSANDSGERVQHRMTYGQATYAGFSLTCECGWSKTSRYPAGVNKAISEREMHQEQAAHAKHMALVHVAKTHGFNNCGRLCIYSRKAMEAEHKASLSGSSAPVDGGPC